MSFTSSLITSFRSLCAKLHILKEKKESYGYRCLTDQKQFYMENYPEIVMENGSIDDLILMLTGR